jgi:hypothetical protein
LCTVTGCLIALCNMLNEKYIDGSTIKFAMKASTVLNANFFSAWAKELHEKFYDESKSLINFLIGYFAKMYSKVVSAVMVDDMETAMGILHNERKKGNIVRIAPKEDDVYFVRSEKRKAMTGGHVPLYRHIIGLSYINLDAMHKAVCDKNTKVVCYNTQILLK